MIIFDVDNIPNNVAIGIQGENKAKTLFFNIGQWIDQYGDGTVLLLFKRLGESVIYPAEVSKEDNLVRWTITSTETAKWGKHDAALVFKIGETIVKSRKFTCCVSQSLTANTDHAPDPYQSYIDTVITNAQSAEESASAAAAESEAAMVSATAAENSASDAARSAAAAKDSEDSAANYAEIISAFMREPMEIEDKDGNISISYKEVDDGE